MESKDLRLKGLKLIRPQVYGDERGFFLETYSQIAYRAAGIPCDFVQDNHSLSKKGTLRGLHYQRKPGQAKLLRVARGRIWDVAVDIRVGSPTFGEWEAVELSAEEHNQLFVPVGFAHGFVVLSEEAEVLYKVSKPYDPTEEKGICWDDPEIAVAWPISEPLLSQRDRENESFADYRRRLESQA